LHPILLFVTFRFVFGFDHTVQQPVYAYWLTVSGCASALVIICFAVHYLIELPCMNASGKVTAGIEVFLHRITKNDTNDSYWLHHTLL
ncbi:MAG: hypothetical protein ABIY62_07515, partial [Ginsengibacter sp.]